jgi:hypothetical protein
MVDRLFSDAGLAALYDALCPREQKADFDFYLPLVMSATAVLDVGCGTDAMLHAAKSIACSCWSGARLRTNMRAGSP